MHGGPHTVRQRLEDYSAGRPDPFPVKSEELCGRSGQGGSGADFQTAPDPVRCGTGRSDQAGMRCVEFQAGGARVRIETGRRRMRRNGSELPGPGRPWPELLSRFDCLAQLRRVLFRHRAGEPVSVCRSISEAAADRRKVADCEAGRIPQVQAKG